MAGSLTSDMVKGPTLPPPADPGWGGGGGGEDSPGASRRASFTGLFVVLVSIAMVFAAFTVAFLMRRGLSDDWTGMPKPPILLVNTAVLIASSIVLDISRRALKNRHRSQFNFWWSLATGLGILFLVGQALAWHEVHASGIFLASTPASAFFFLLTAAHAFHLIGGVAALAYVDFQALRLRLGPAKRTAIDISAIYWHFLDAVWVYLMVLLYVWA